MNDFLEVKSLFWINTSWKISTFKCVAEPTQLRKMFAFENQRDRKAETVYFKIDEKKFCNLIREIKEERSPNIMETNTTAEGNFKVDLDPSFQMGLKWFNRIN